MMKLVKAQHQSSFGLSDKGPVKDQMTGMSKDQFRTAISNDTMFQIAQADVSKALKQAGYTITGLMPNLVNAATDAAWGQVGKLSSGCGDAKAELEAVKARDVEMKLAHLREISMLRDQIRHVNSDSLKAIQSLNLENVQLYEPLNYLDEETKTLVMQIVEEKLKELLTEDSDATVVEGKKLNHFAFNAFLHGRLEEVNSKYKEDNMSLREEVKALKIELSAQKERSSSALATLQEEFRATQESLENEIAHLKQELKSERSRAEGLSKELEKVKQQHQEALVRQSHYVAACQASFSQEQMETFKIKSSHDKLKTELNQLFSDHVDLKYELQETKKSEAEKMGLVTQVRQLERQAEKEAARVSYLQGLFQMVVSEKTQGGQLEDQVQHLVEGAVAQVDQDNNPEMIQANMEELRNALQLAESRSRQVGQEKRQLEAELRDEKMSLLLTRAVNESLRPAGLRLPQNGSDDENMFFESMDVSQHHRKLSDEFDGSEQNSETQSTGTVNPDRMAGHHSDASLSSAENTDGMATLPSVMAALEASVQSLEASVHGNATLNSTTTVCDTDFQLAAEDHMINMDSQGRMSPSQRMALFAFTHEDLMRICYELDGSDDRTNELEAAVADAMDIIRRYQSREMQIEAPSDEEHAKMVQEQMEQLQKALMHEVSHRRSLQEQYRVQEEKLTKLLEEAPSQSPMESRVQSPSPRPSSDSPKPPAKELSMTSLPSSLKEARSVQALNEKLQRKDDMIKTKQAQIKMLLAENERLRAGSSRTRTELVRLRAKLRMCRCNGQHQSAAGAVTHICDSAEASDPSLRSLIHDEVSADDHFHLPSSSRPATSGVTSRISGVVYEQIDKQETGSLVIGTRPHSSASSRRKQPVILTPRDKPKKEEFHAAIVGNKVKSPTARKQRTQSDLNQSKEAVPDKNLLPELKPTVVTESVNANRGLSAPHKLSKLAVPPAPTTRRHSAPEPTVSLSVLPVSSPEATPAMINLAKSRPASGRPLVKPHKQEL
jgi:hypothetical protein